MSGAKILYPLFICSFLFFSIHVNAQLSSPPKWEAGFHVGAYVYQGDLTPHPYGSIETARPGFGLNVTRIISRSFAARLMFNFTKIAADESIYETPTFRKKRNLAFNTSIKELSLQVKWNVLGSNYDNRKFEPYAFAGAGLAIVHVNRDYSRFDTSYYGDQSPVFIGLTQDLLTPTPRVVAVIPVGGGLRYNINDRLAVTGEATYRFMLTDYLDGFSKSANTSQNDHYLSASVGIVYKFGGGDRYGCPKP